MYVAYCILPIAYAVLVPRLLLPTAYCHCLLAINRGAHWALTSTVHKQYALYITEKQCIAYSNI